MRRILSAIVDDARIPIVDASPRRAKLRHQADISVFATALVVWAVGVEAFATNLGAPPILGMTTITALTAQAGDASRFGAEP